MKQEKNQTEDLDWLKFYGLQNFPFLVVLRNSELVVFVGTESACLTFLRPRQRANYPHVAQGTRQVLLKAAVEKK